MYLHSVLLALLLSFVTPITKAPKSPKPLIETTADISILEGFSVTIFADNLGRGRHLAINERGDVYVHLRAKSEDGASIVGLRDTDADGVADVIHGFEGAVGTGIEVFDNHLYFADDTHVYRAPIDDEGNVQSEAQETIVTLVDGKGHMEKTFTIDPEGNMYVNVGSMSNACQEETRSKESKGVDPCVELETRAGIWKFDARTTNQEQSLDKRYATGIRNACAITWNPTTNSVFAVQHGRDDLHRFWPELFSEDENLELPAEEIFEVFEGDDFGWPYCFYNHFDGNKYLNPEYGGDGKKIERCADAKRPVVGLPGHWAPNDILIYTGDQFPTEYNNGAFVAFHGSWNRLGAPQDGFNVAFVPLKDGKANGEYFVFADDFEGSASVKSPGEAAFRPCGLAQGPDGSIFVLDSVKGRVWKISYQG